MIITVGPQGHSAITSALASESQRAEQDVERWNHRALGLKG